ncbi:hypothetical protein GCM10010232_16670 [Streptomyces amakusaensis]|uniref:Excalibur calcium-binding domain-containing protein n=1 Tax=Streptomyces amakusaensis TaxID=67271 RepID=A0ABW0AKG3_9ACTN
MSNAYPPNPYGPTPPPAAGDGTSPDGKRKTLLGCGGMVAITLVLAAIVGACAPDDVVKTKAVPGPTVTATRTVTAPPTTPPATSPAREGNDQGKATPIPTRTSTPTPTRTRTSPPTPTRTPSRTPTPTKDSSDGSTSTGGGGGNVYYKNCTAVRAAGADPIRRGDPGFGPHLDRDGDGIACE